MKRNLRLSVCMIVSLLALQFNLIAQSPPELNYQAVVRNVSGQIVASTAVAVRFTIHNDSATGTPVYTETIPTTTNALGLVNVQIGSTASLNVVNWSQGAKFLQVEADINNAGYVNMGTSKLISVPYALFSANSAPGPTGLQGPVGATGPTGASGSDGVTGATGLQGNIGLQGATGTQGIQGITGVTGASGNDGVQGPTGLQGNVGAQGPTGIQGIQGTAGPTGAQGVSVASVTDNGNGTATVLLTNGNSSVITLPVGPQGVQGPTGTNGGGVPAGAITYFAAATVPAGYLECNGQAVSRTTYAALFAFVGTIYGGGDGTTTFNLPDLRGEFVRGLDDGRGVDAGRQVGSAQDGTGIGDQVHQTVELYYDNNDGALYNNFTTNSSSGYAGTTRSISYFKVRPRNVALMPCIKY